MSPDYAEGRRAQALIAIGRAIQSALQDAGCTTEEVLRACAFASDPANLVPHPDDPDPHGVPAIDDLSWAIDLAARPFQEESR